MRKILNIGFIIICVLSFSACNEFLAKDPSKSSNVTPKTIEDLEYLLNSYSEFQTEENNGAVYMSDSYGLIPELHKASAEAYEASQAWFATWNVEYTPYDNSTGTFFTNEYKKIFTANTVLNNLQYVEGSDERKKELELECKFIRAYSLWNLAQTYCLPYCEKNFEELGLTIKNSTSFEESASRATLKATYDAIKTDLDEALAISNNLDKLDNKYKSWRVSKPAVNGFAARYYLSVFDYENALKYADAALSAHSELVDYNIDMRYEEPIKIVSVPDPNNAPNLMNVEVKFPYTHKNQMDPTDKMEWKELMYYRFVSTGFWWFLPSKELLNAYGETASGKTYDKNHDLRFVYHIVDNYSYDQAVQEYEYPGYVFFFRQWVPSGPTTAEMLLIKAECEARGGDVTSAMATVNRLRAVRMDVNAPADVINLSANSKEEAVREIVQERWREMPFSYRWFDLRRLNHNPDSFDDLGDVVRNFFDYNTSAILNTEKEFRLEPGSLRYAAPLTDSDIQSSNGAIVQNRY